MLILDEIERAYIYETKHAPHCLSGEDLCVALIKSSSKLKIEQMRIFLMQIDVIVQTTETTIAGYVLIGTYAN